MMCGRALGHRPGGPGQTRASSRRVPLPQTTLRTTRIRSLAAGCRPQRRAPRGPVRREMAQKETRIRGMTVATVRGGGRPRRPRRARPPPLVPAEKLNTAATPAQPRPPAPSGAFTAAVAATQAWPFGGGWRNRGLGSGRRAAAGLDTALRPVYRTRPAEDGNRTWGMRARGWTWAGTWTRSCGGGGGGACRPSCRSGPSGRPSLASRTKRWVRRAGRAGAGR